jgi:hypothetical protein
MTEANFETRAMCLRELHLLSVDRPPMRRAKRIATWVPTWNLHPRQNVTFLKSHLKGQGVMVKPRDDDWG